MEQSKQWSKNFGDELDLDAIAQVYLEATQDSKDDALLRGQQLAMELKMPKQNWMFKAQTKPEHKQEYKPEEAELKLQLCFKYLAKTELKKKEYKL